MMQEKVDGYNVQSITYRHKQADYVMRHKHKHYEIVYYYEGKGLTTVYGETVFNFKYSADSIIIIPPEVYHDEYATEPTEIVCNQLNISGEQPSTALFFKKTAHTATVFDKIKSLMSQIAALWFAMEEGRGDTSAKIYELLGHLEISVFKLIHSEKKRRSEYTTELIGIVNKYIGNYYLNRINYKILAEELGYSYDRFRHIFVENTGMTLHVYQQGFKLDYAKQKLITTNMKIYDLAVKCGFSNSIRFCEWFKNLAGISPQRFRALNRNVYRWGVIMHYSDIGDAEKKQLLVDVGDMTAERTAVATVACTLEKDGIVDLHGLTAALDDASRLSGICARYGSRVPVAIGNGGARLLVQTLGEMPPHRATLLFVGTNTLGALLADARSAALLAEKAETVVLVDDGKDTSALASLDNLPLLFVEQSQSVALDLDELETGNPIVEAFGSAGIHRYVGADVVALAYSVFGDGDMIKLRQGRIDTSGGRAVFVGGVGPHKALCIREPAKLREQLKALIQKTDEAR